MWFNSKDSESGSYHASLFSFFVHLVIRVVGSLTAICFFGGNSNDVQSELYPSLILFPAGKRSGIYYEGEISVSGVIEFILSYGSNIQHISGMEGKLVSFLSFTMVLLCSLTVPYP